MYHGSPRRFEVLEPRNEHGDPGLGNVAFASPSRIFAAAYAGAAWGDRDLEQGCRHRGGKLVRMTLREMRPGAFLDVFDGRRGYLYHLDSAAFAPPPGRTSPWEQVCPRPIKPLAVEVIDVLATLQGDPRVVMHCYDPAAPENRLAVQRQIARLRQMAPESRSEYLRWRLEPAPPEIVQMFREAGHAISRTIFPM